MLGCANKNSDEWKQLLADANGDEDKAMELWIEKGYHKDANLNTESDDIKVDEGPKDPTSHMAGLIKTLIETKLKSLKERKVHDQTRIENEYKNFRDNYTTLLNPALKAYIEVASDGEAGVSLMTDLEDPLWLSDGATGQAPNFHP